MPMAFLNRLAVDSADTTAISPGEHMDRLGQASNRNPSDDESSMRPSSFET